MSTPVGWYPTPRGLRYWDGVQWTEHLAPAPLPRAPQTVRGTGSSQAAKGLSADKTRPGPAVWFGWGGLALVAVLGAASSGFSGLLLLSGLYVLVVSVVALVRGPVRWARLRGRAAGGVALAAAMGLFLVGGATADPPAATYGVSASVAPSSPAPTPSVISPSPSPSPSSASPTPTPTLTPTPTAIPTPSVTKSAATPATARKGTALAAVAALTVKGRAPKTGYSREAFGQAWFDTNRNGCDTRNDILRRDLVKKDMKNSCKVLAGALRPDPYTGTNIRFVYGGASEVDIDHVVSVAATKVGD